jgi:hypothetical protein
VVHGTNQQVDVTAYGNLLPYLETTVINGVLHIGYRNSTRIQNDNSLVIITIPSLTGIRNFGTSEISVDGPFKVAELDIRASGTGRLTILGMQAENTRLVSTGTSDIRAFGLRTQKADIHQSGTGNTEITVDQDLKARLSGTGNIYYKGNPRLELRIEGTGDIIRK